MKITDTKKVNQTNKKKKTNRANTGPSFASMVDQAGDTQAPKGPAAPAGISALDAPVYEEGAAQEQVPSDAKERGKYMLDRLEELEREILSGEPSQAAARLKQALETKAINRDDLPPRLKELLDEIELRANIEVAKLES